MGQTKLGWVSGLRDWWWGRRPEVEMEEPPWRITVYPPGPGAKLSELARYFRERWQEFVFWVAVAIVAALVLTLVGLG